MIVCPIFQFLVLPYYISLITILSFVFTDFIHHGEAGHKKMNTFGKKRLRRQQLLAARQSRFVGTDQSFHSEDSQYSEVS